VVVVEGGKIQAMGVDVAIPKGATIIDLGGLTLLPGPLALGKNDPAALV
jgi:imidazolonepropionase-like amidohydrolase